MAIKAGGGAVSENGQRIPMTTAQAAVYSLVIDLIYENGGEFPNNAEDIASHFSDMGKAKARAVVGELVGMGKLYIVGGRIHEKLAEKLVKTRRKLGETRAEVGRKGGVASGVSRRQSSDYSDIAEANASSKREAEIEREESSSSHRSSAQGRETFFDRVLEAVGINTSDRWPEGWMPPTGEMHVNRWRDELGLSEDEIVSVAAGTRTRWTEPPKWPSALDKPMRRFAGDRQIAALTPLQPATPVAHLPTANRPHRIITSEERRAAMARGREEAS
jgi:hypothetical protein